MSIRKQEGGYALLAVLWMTVGITAIAFLITTTARSTIATSRNRVALTVAAWSAEACAAYARAALLDTHSIDAFHQLDVGQILRASHPPADLDCELTVRPVGSRLNVNDADSATLALLFRHAGMTNGHADSTATTIARHKPYDNRLALRLLADLADAALLDSLLDVEPGPISVNYAPGPVLALLPGFTDRTIHEVLDARERGAPIATFHELALLLSADAPDAAARLPAVCVFQPAAWILTVRAHAGRPAVTSVLELRVAQDGRITRWRSWVE